MNVNQGGVIFAGVLCFYLLAMRDIIRWMRRTGRLSGD